MLLKIDQFIHAVFFGETFYRVIFMLPHATEQIGGHACIESAVALACQYIDRRLFFTILIFWIPASAGMTNGEVGIVKWLNLSKCTVRFFVNFFQARI